MYIYIYKLLRFFTSLNPIFLLIVNFKEKLYQLPCIIFFNSDFFVCRLSEFSDYVRNSKQYYYKCATIMLTAILVQNFC